MNNLRVRRIKKAIAPYALIAPAVVLIAVFLYGVLGGVLQGFGIMPFLGKTEFTLDYYAAALSRPDLMSSLGFSLYLAAFSSLIALVGGILLSAAITRAKASRVVQLLDISIPLMTAHILVVLFVVSLFSGTGLIPRLLHAAGLIEGVGSFSSVVGDPSGWGIILTYAWKEIPFVAFCAVTIMGHVSNRYGEAAFTLGASPLRAFFSVTLPLCKGALLKAFLIVFAFAFGTYEVPFLLGATTPKALPVLAYTEFQNPDLMNRMDAMAINGIMVLICGILALIYFVILQRERKR